MTHPDLRRLISTSKHSTNSIAKSEVGLEIGGVGNILQTMLLTCREYPILLGKVATRMENGLALAKSLPY
jgi:hypothetical protein